MKNFQGFTTLQILAEIQNMMTEIKCDPEQFPRRIIFMSMYNDVVWREERYEDFCIASKGINKHVTEMTEETPDDTH